MSSPSDVRPLWGALGYSFCKVKLSARNETKQKSRKRECWRFCIQASNDEMLSFFVGDHCLGALLEFTFQTIKNSEEILFLV